MFFGDEDFKERVLMDNHKRETEQAAAAAELRKSSSLFTVGSANKKLFDTKAPTKQRLSIHPSSIISPTGTSSRSGTSGASSEKKMTAISSIGGDLLRSKTADFERFLINQNTASTGTAEQRTYKRNQIISSAHNSKKK